MQEIETRADGVVTYWHSVRSSFDQLEQKLADLPYGVGQKIMCERRKPASILKAALEDVFDASSQLVRRTKKANTFEVVREERGATENTYTHEFGAAVDPKTGELAFSQDLGWETDQKVRLAYEAQTDRVTASQVGRIMVDGVKECFGTSLRDRGGVYWVPGDKLWLWLEIAQRVEACGLENGGNQTFLIRHALDQDALRAVHTAIVREVRSEARQAREAIDAEPGEKALERQRDELAALGQKIKFYENVLGETLPEMQQLCEETVTAAATAQLRAVAVRGAA